MQTLPFPKGRWLSRGLWAVVMALVCAFVAAGGAGVTQAAPDLTLFVNCWPDSIRTESEAAFTCTTSVTSNEDTPIWDVSLSANLAPDLSLPSYEIFDRTVNGAPVYVSPSQITFDFPEIPPFNTVDAVSRIIFGVRDAGTYGFRLDLIADGTVVDSATVSFEAVADSPFPPTNLEVTNALIETLPSPEPLSPPHQLSPPNSLPPGQEHAVYEVLIRNVSDTPMSGLTVWDRVSPGALMGANNPPAVSIDDETGISRWELGALGPGGETRIRFTLEQAGVECAYSGNTALVTAHAPDGEESYVARSDRAVMLGFDCPLGQGGDGFGAEPELALPATGSGGAGPYGVSWAWLAAVALAVGGIVAFGLAVTRGRRYEG